LATDSAILRDFFKLKASFRHASVVGEYSRRTGDSVANPYSRTGDSVANPSPRTGDSVANPSQRFYESSRNIYTLSSVSGSVVHPKLFFSGSGSYLDLNFISGFGFESGSGLFMKNTLEIQII
jgi:hypothetical protein